MKFLCTIPSFTLVLLLGSVISWSDGAECGEEAGGAVCHGGLCCSKWGWCGTKEVNCGEGCQSQCSVSIGGEQPPSTPEEGRGGSIGGEQPPSTPEEGGGGSGGEGGSHDLSSLFSEHEFNEMLKHRNSIQCPAKEFFTYQAFVAAANKFIDFARKGDDATRKREIAAFFGQTSHETTGGWTSANDGPYAWGYCFLVEKGGTSADYCVANSQWPCVPGKKYFGRGPIQLSYNYYYGPAGNALGYDLLSDPDAVARDAVLSFETALWFWMTPKPPKPSCHGVMIGEWTPSAADVVAGRLPGYGVTTNIVGGGLECGHGPDDRVEDRIGFYRRYCDILGVDYGENLDCYNQAPFASTL